MHTPCQLYPFRGRKLAILNRHPSPLQNVYRTLSPAAHGPLARELLASDDCASRFQTLSLILLEHEMHIFSPQVRTKMTVIEEHLGVE